MQTLYLSTYRIMKADHGHPSYRKHILQDLEPYICTFPECGLDSMASQHAWMEHELLVHRTQWQCPQCTEQAPSSPALEEHIYRHHKGDFAETQLETILSRAKRPLKVIRPSECPFCDEDWAQLDAQPETQGPPPIGEVVVGIDEFRRHVGHHLQQIALFSLPRLDGDPEEDSVGPVGVTDQDVLPKGTLWVREDCGRGWSIVARRRETFMALSFFLEMHLRLAGRPMRSDSPLGFSEIHLSRGKPSTEYGGILVTREVSVVVEELSDS